MKAIFTLTLALTIYGLLASFPASGQDRRSQSSRTGAYSPAEELTGFKLADGFVIELVASQQDGIVNPVDLTFDDAGRLWTQTARMYPLDPVADIKWMDLLKLMDDPEAQKQQPAFRRILDLYQGKTKGTDQVLVVSDFYGNRPAKVTVWADSLTIPMSILPYRDGAYVVQGSELFFLDDKDHDGRADQRVPLFTGFGYTDTHTMGHGLVRAPGNWVYLSQGGLNKGAVTSLKSGTTVELNFSKIARFPLDATRLEVVSSGLNNVWGFQLRDNGQWYGSEANDLGHSVVPLEPGTGFPGIGNDRLRPYQPFMPKLHEFRVGGTGLSGLAFADDASGSFPAEFRDVAFLANPITNSINAVRIVRNPDGSVSARHLPDLLTAQDDWFRPVNLEFGPDGCLYVADWYNKIVSHNELPTSHPDRDKKNGRIWRIRHVSQTPGEIPDFYQIKTEALPEYLKSPSLWAKRAAWHQISDRPLTETAKLIPTLLAMTDDASLDVPTRVHALWCLEGLQQYDERVIASLLKSPQAELRREAVRSLTSFSRTAAQVATAVRGLVEDDNAMVRSQALRTLGETEAAVPLTIELLLRASKPELPGEAMGGGYQRKFERYLARLALERFPDALQTYLASPAADEIPATNRLWAIETLPKAQKEAEFLKLWPKAKLDSLDESTFVGVVNMLGNREIYEAVLPLLQKPDQARAYVTYALRNEGQIRSPVFSKIITAPVLRLLGSKTAAEVDLALDAVGRFKITEARDAIVALLDKDTPDVTRKLSLKALENDPAANREIFSRTVRDKKLNFGLRAAALDNLVRADSADGQRALAAWLPELADADKAELADLLSASRRGAALVMDVYGKDPKNMAVLELPVAERIADVNPADRRSQALLENVKKREAAKKEVVKGKIVKYTALAEKRTGNPPEGKVLFQTCLLCHQVGNSGQNIAPALDGSASRESQALLTAILDPDAAVESGYAVYRVNKKDGSVVEGFLINKNDLGTTLAFMGGSKVFIESAAIKNQFAIRNRSFMVKGLLDGYSDNQVADLLSYIRTLK